MLETDNYINRNILIKRSSVVSVAVSGCMSCADIQSENYRGGINNQSYHHTTGRGANLLDLVCVYTSDKIINPLKYETYHQI